MINKIQKAISLQNEETNQNLRKMLRSGKITKEEYELKLKPC